MSFIIFVIRLAQQTIQAVIVEVACSSVYSGEQKLYFKNTSVLLSFSTILEKFFEAKTILRFLLMSSLKSSPVNSSTWTKIRIDNCKQYENRDHSFSQILLSFRAEQERSIGAENLVLTHLLYYLQIL